MTLSTARIYHLISLMDNSSTSIADEAADELSINHCDDQIVDAVLSGQLKTAKGRIRATNNLLLRGKALPRALDVYIALLSDKSYYVAHNAIFGIVFWQDDSTIPVLEQKKRNCAESKLIKCIDLALRAIRRRDPFLFSKHFHDVNNVWELDPKRFAKHIGPL